MLDFGNLKSDSLQKDQGLKRPHVAFQGFKFKFMRDAYLKAKNTEDSVASSPGHPSIPQKRSGSMEIRRAGSRRTSTFGAWTVTWISQARCAHKFTALRKAPASKGARAASV